MTNAELLEQLFENTTQSIKDQMELQGFNASGETSDSLFYQVHETGGEILGSGSFAYIINGRGPGKFPPPPSIIKWIEAKGIQDMSISVNSLAYLIGRKIAMFGSDVFRGIRKGLDIKVAVDKNLDDYKKAIAKNTIDQIRNIFRQLKTKK